MGQTATIELLENTVNTTEIKKTITSLSNYHSILFCLENATTTAASNAVKYNPIVLPTNVFRTLNANQSNRLRVESQADNERHYGDIYYINDTSVAMLQSGGYRCALYGIK